MTQTNRLPAQAKQPLHVPALNVQELMTLGNILAKSGYFPDARSGEQAAVKVMAGREMGFGAFASMRGIYIGPDGTPQIKAQLMSAAIKGSGRYDYEIIQADRDRCELKFLEKRGTKMEPVNGPTISYTFAQAEQDGVVLGQKTGKILPAWKAYPDDMLFARVLSKGFRRYFPDLLGGVQVYTREEMLQDEDLGPKTVTIIQDSANGTVPTQPSQPSVIDEHQLAELLQLLQETGTDQDKLKTAYTIQELGKLPATAFDEVRTRLWARKTSQQAAQAMKTGPTAPSSPAPATLTGPAPASKASPGELAGADPAFISREQFDLLTNLGDSLKIDWKAFREFMGVERWSKIPASWFTWMRLFLSQGKLPDFAELPQTIKARSFSQLLPHQVESMTKHLLFDRIDSLVLQLAIGREDWDRKTLERYGTTDAARMTLQQLEELEASLARATTQKGPVAK